MATIKVRVSDYDKEKGTIGFRGGFVYIKEGQPVQIQPGDELEIVYKAEYGSQVDHIFVTGQGRDRTEVALA